MRISLPRCQENEVVQVGKAFGGHPACLRGGVIDTKLGLTRGASTDRRVLTARLAFETLTAKQE